MRASDTASSRAIGVEDIVLATGPSAPISRSKRALRVLRPTGATSHLLRRAWAAPLLLQCAVWMVLGPIAPQLHQSVSRHGHVYSAERNCIVDVWVKRNVPLGHARISAQPAIDADRGQAEVMGRGSPCLFSNANVQKVERQATTTTHVVVSVQEVGILPLSDEAPFRDLLFLAPKHSPPRRAA